MTSQTVDLDGHLKRLTLAYTRRNYRSLIARAEKETWTFHAFLEALVLGELSHRHETRTQRVTRKAKFPFLKTIDDFVLTHQTAIQPGMLGSFLSPDLVTEGRCLILRGLTGRGKTHLAVAIAYRAIQNGFEALCTTAAALIDDLSRASREGRFRDVLAHYVHPHVLVIDELGYLTYGPDAANVLFHVVNERHLKKRGMIFTTNKRLADWGKVLHDPDLAAAIIDRVLERGREIEMDGPSWRTKHLRVDPVASPMPESPTAIISGKQLPEFPEPAPGGMQGSRLLEAYFVLSG